MSTSKHAIQQEALSNALNNQSVMNYQGIFEGFMSRGIPESEIKPRENVFTMLAQIVARAMRSTTDYRWSQL